MIDLLLIKSMAYTLSQEYKLGEKNEKIDLGCNPGANCMFP